MQVAATLQKSPTYYPEGSTTIFAVAAFNPTGREFQHGFNTDREWVFKANGAYTFPWDVTAAANLNVNQGTSRTVVINGPGAVAGGPTATNASSTISYNTLEFQPRGSARLAPTKTVTAWASNNRSNANFTAPNTIVPPRVFRFGAQVGF